MCWRLISIPRLQNRAPFPYAFQLIVQSLLNRVWLCDPINCSTPGFPVLHYLPEFAQTHVHWVSDAIQPSHPLALHLSHHQALYIRWPKYWSSASASEYSSFISFRIDWFDLLAVQGTLKSLLQHHSSKASFFSAQPSLWYSSHTCTWLKEKYMDFYKNISHISAFLVHCLGLS